MQGVIQVLFDYPLLDARPIPSVHHLWKHNQSNQATATYSTMFYTYPLVLNVNFTLLDFPEKQRGKIREKAWKCQYGFVTYVYQKYDMPQRNTFIALPPSHIDSSGTCGLPCADSPQPENRLTPEDCPGFPQVAGKGTAKGEREKAGKRVCQTRSI